MSAPLAQWFHGDIPREDAVTRLLEAFVRNPSQPHFLVRASGQEPGSFALSVVDTAGAMRHIMIRRLPSGEFSVAAGENVQAPVFPTVDALLECVSVSLFSR